ncbi:MAG: hypothetical protein HUK12_01735 [Muribaculaceae bacterium]|nr:hypothetical protein [Muribaculaceae bacterium]
MKKLFFAVMALVAVSFAACNGGNSENANATEADSAAAVLTEQLNAALTDSASFATAMQEVNTKIETLKAEGASEEVIASYKSKLVEFYEANKAKVEELKVTVPNTLNELVGNIIAIPETVKAEGEAAVADAEAAAKSDAEAVKEAVKADVNKQVDAAKEEANKKAADAVDKAAQDLKDKIKF